MEFWPNFDPTVDGNSFSPSLWLRVIQMWCEEVRQPPDDLKTICLQMVSKVGILEAAYECLVETVKFAYEASLFDLATLDQLVQKCVYDNMFARDYVHGVRGQLMGKVILAILCLDASVGRSECDARLLAQVSMGSSSHYLYVMERLVQRCDPEVRSDAGVLGAVISVASSVFGYQRFYPVHIEMIELLLDLNFAIPRDISLYSAAVSGSQTLLQRVLDTFPMERREPLVVNQHVLMGACQGGNPAMIMDILRDFYPRSGREAYLRLFDLMTMADAVRSTCTELIALVDVHLLEWDKLQLLQVRNITHQTVQQQEDELHAREEKHIQETQFTPAFRAALSIKDPNPARTLRCNDDQAAETGWTYHSERDNFHLSVRLLKALGRMGGRCPAALLERDADEAKLKAAGFQLSGSGYYARPLLHSTRALEQTGY